MSIMFLWQSAQPGSNLFTRVTANFGVPYFTLSATLNVLVTAIITTRLLLYRRKIRQSLGTGQASSIPYASIAAIIIESSMIYTGLELLFIVPYALNSQVASLFLGALGYAPVGVDKELPFDNKTGAHSFL